jgi:diadenosine tetraphosphate (Ap4A) HIT family hydrolase
VTEHTDEEGLRIVKLAGTPAQVDAAATMIEAKINDAAERAAERGGKALKQAAKRARVAKPKRATEIVPEFDRKTGQLVMVERRVEQDEEAQAAEVNEAPEALSAKRVKRLQRFDKEGGAHALLPRREGWRPLAQGHGRCGAQGQHARRAAHGRRGPEHGGPHLAQGQVQGDERRMSVDDEYDHDDVEIADDRRSRQSDAKLAKGELAQQKRAERNQSLTAQKAEDRFNAIKHLVIALGEYVVLRLQDHSPLSSGHCVLQPVEHVAALSEARARRWPTRCATSKKCLIRMAEQAGEELIFWETSLSAQHSRARGMAIECVPLRSRDAAHRSVGTHTRQSHSTLDSARIHV